MAETPESERPRKPSPKRGALPSPKAEIAKAKPYIPEECEESAGEVISPEDLDRGENRRGGHGNP